MRLFLPVRLFAGPSDTPTISVWSKDLDEAAAPFLLRRTMDDGTVEDRLLDFDRRDEENGFGVLTPLVAHATQSLELDKWGFERLESPVDDLLWCDGCKGLCELAWERGEGGGPGRWHDTAEAMSSCCSCDVYLDPSLIVQWEPDPNDWGAFERGGDE